MSKEAAPMSLLSHARNIAVVLLLVALATGARGDDPLSNADLVKFLRAGISERTILAELHDRGFSDPFDLAREDALRDAGASETLIVAVRRAAPAHGAAATGTPSEGAAPRAPRAAGDSSFPAVAAPVVHGPTFGASTRTVRVPVSVIDKGGQPVMGLHGEDFQVMEDGKRQEVTFFSGERRPLRIALALDVSASMENKVREVEDALRHFIDLLEPADEIMVITFNSQVDVVQDFTSDRARLASVLSMIQPAGATALYDAAAEAIERVGPGAAESKAVVLVTDGVDTQSAISFSNLREMARRSEVPVFSIALGGDTTLFNIFSGPAEVGADAAAGRADGRAAAAPDRAERRAISTPPRCSTWRTRRAAAPRS
jgi:uncharacterized protein YegL